ncbi:hypothetical protein H0E87_005551 [Populus deltoides]|uniref:CobW/HypB/UreG nucleotide-binding domain-containing protein n=1 Tax=Populus deltoides TaxID=3696 RepID=A0A8T2ZK22_POPDE|nr:hypothetical protein H0E87_005551 [Populus deltoides]
MSALVGRKTASRVGPDGRVYHSHDGQAPHSHEPIYSPGFLSRRAQPILTRDFNERAFTAGIGGLVGTGKTALMLSFIVFEEDGEFLIKHGALPEERIRAVETGGCPHAAIREDISINLGLLEELSNLFIADLLLCESGVAKEIIYLNLYGADNLAANFSRELADYIIYIIDVSGGDNIPRKGGPGITHADLLVINKTDLAPAVGADLVVMERDALRMWDGGPFVFAQAVSCSEYSETTYVYNHSLEVALISFAVHNVPAGEAWTWRRGNCEPHFTRLGSGYWEKAPLTWCIRRVTWHVSVSIWSH